MCGLFTISPKVVSRISETEARPQEAPRISQNPHPAPQTSTHARMEAVMGIPSRYRNRNYATIRHDSQDRSTTFPLKDVGSGNISPNKGETPADGTGIPRNGSLHSRSLDNLKYHPRTRPRMYERSRYPSSPLANVGRQTLYTENSDKNH